MNEKKLIITMVAFIVAGIVFLAAGFYFSSKNYQQALADSHENPEEKRKAVITGKLCGIIALALGGLTLASGIIIKIIPQMFRYLSFFYVLALIACFAALTFSFGRKK